jgi:hypothetical protein
MRWAGHVACTEEMRNAYKILLRKSKEKRPLGRTRYRWEDTIKMDLKEIRCNDLDWIHLAQDTDQWWALGVWQ